MTRRIKISYQIVTPESAEQGDVEEIGWSDEEGIEIEPDEIAIEYYEGFFEAVVGMVEDLITDRSGGVEASSSSYHTGLWYTGIDPICDRAFIEKGEHRIESFHLDGFTELEQVAIFRKLTK